MIKPDVTSSQENIYQKVIAGLLYSSNRLQAQKSRPSAASLLVKALFKQRAAFYLL
jgi:hypothetical protein